jgi:ADP-ribose pyrophosphatase
MSDDEPIGDRKASVEIVSRHSIGDGFLPYQRFEIAVQEGGATARQQRDVLRGGAVAAVLPVDLSRDQIVLIRQFRLAAHLATGLGQMVEIVAGRLDPHESAASAAARECFEEIGIRPDRMAELFTVVPSPGICDERVTFFLAAIDTATLPQRGGTDSGEYTQPFAVPIDAALAAVRAGRIHNAAAVNGLQWLALNRADLGKVLEGGEPVASPADGSH